LLRLNSTDFLSTDVVNAIKAAKNPPALGFRFLAQASPRRKEEPAEIADFETVAQASEGVPSLGVLRMDVDDVGWLFQHGLGEDASISRVCSMSFLLHLFFEGWLNSLCIRWNLYDGKDKVYAIYAGGDDLLITSSWSEIAELAWNIHRDFSEFTCYNPLVHISGGTTVDDPHFPLYQLIETATESLESGAKRMPGKNAFTFLGQTLNWSQLQKVSEWRDILKDIIAIDGRIEDGKAPRTLVHLLMELHQSYLEGQTMDADRRLFHGPTIHYGPWMWHAAYHLSRMMERVEGPAQAHLAEIRETLMQAERLSVELPQLALAARWVELLTRTEGL
jgi:CRISPR-associated protein Csm1